MDDFKHLCPVCLDNDKVCYLQLRQINLKTAVYLCKDIKCSYPKGFSWIYVDRNWEDFDTSSDSSSDSDASNSIIISSEEETDNEKKPILIQVQPKCSSNTELEAFEIIIENQPESTENYKAVIPVLTNNENTKKCTKNKLNLEAISTKDKPKKLNERTQQTEQLDLDSKNGTNKLNDKLESVECSKVYNLRPKNVEKTKTKNLKSEMTNVEIRNKKLTTFVAPFHNLLVTNDVNIPKSPSIKELHNEKIKETITNHSDNEYKEHCREYDKFEGLQRPSSKNSKKETVSELRRAAAKYEAFKIPTKSTKPEKANRLKLKIVQLPQNTQQKLNNSARVNVKEKGKSFSVIQTNLMEKAMTLRDTILEINDKSKIVIEDIASEIEVTSTANIPETEDISMGLNLKDIASEIEFNLTEKLDTIVNETPKIKDKSTKDSISKPVVAISSKTKENSTKSNLEADASKTETKKSYLEPISTVLDNSMNEIDNNNRNNNNTLDDFFNDLSKLMNINDTTKVTESKLNEVPPTKEQVNNQELTFTEFIPGQINLDDIKFDDFFSNDNQSNNNAFDEVDSLLDLFSN